jgi:hypothetical protein
LPLQPFRHSTHVTRVYTHPNHFSDRNINWKERLHIEESTGCGFDTPWCENAGFVFEDANGNFPARVRLSGMGPKLLISDVSTADQPIIRWRLRVRGNTAAEFGVVPVALEPSHTALHKNLAVPEAQRQRCTGFCSQITAGSLLPLKFPVMRGTVLDLVARRGRLQAVLQYPSDAKEITWQNGQAVQRPYRGPSQLRFELDFPDDHDVRLAVTAWAKAAFEVLHEPALPYPASSKTRRDGRCVIAASAEVAEDASTLLSRDVRQQAVLLPSSTQHSKTAVAHVTRSDSRCTLSLDGTEEPQSSTPKAGGG